MSANLTAATNPGAAANPIAATKAGTTAGPSRPAAEARDTRPADDRFDRRLDAARQQHDRDATAKRRDEAPSQSAPAVPAPAKAGDAGAPVEAAAAVATDDAESTETDAAALAAMLALLGQTVLGAPAAAATAAAAGNPQGPMLPATAPSASASGKLPAAAWSGLAAASDGTAATATATATDTVATVPDTALSALVTGAAHAAQDDHASLQDLAAQAALAVAPGPHDAGHATAAPHVLSIASPLGTPAFGSELGRQVTWLGMQDIKQARIRLHPQELGSLDVHVTVNHNRVDVTFAVQHPAAVHAVQQSLAQLDSMLAQHGLSLGQADVGQRQQGAPRGEAAGGIAGVDAPDDSGASVRPLASTALPGLLDTFA